MKVRVLRGFAGYEPGQVFDDWPAGMCEIFIGKGLIERLDEPTELVTAEDDKDVERAEIPARRKRK